jgi:hypothetical protein
MLNCLVIMLSFTTIVIALFIMLNYKSITHTEKFSDISSNIMTNTAQSGLGQYNASLTSTPCRIRTKDGKDFEFKVGDKQLEWYDVPNQPNTCALDLSSLDLANIQSNCDKNNSKLYDGKVVKNIYLNDNAENKRCEIQFNSNPDRTTMNTWWQKQNSYIREADCQRAFREVKQLTIEVQNLKQNIKDTKVRIANNEAELRNKSQQLANLNQQIQTLKSEKADMERELANLKNQLAQARRELEETIKERNDLQKSLNALISNSERQLLENRLRSNALDIKLREDLVAQTARNLADRQQRIANADSQLNIAKSNLSSQESKVATLVKTLNKDIGQRDALNSTLQQKNNQLVTMQKQVRVFKKVSETQQAGGNGGGQGQLVCAEGSHVNEIFGAAGGYVTRLGIKCTDGKYYGPLGGGGDNAFQVTSPDGFNKLEAKSGWYVDNLKFFANNQPIRQVGGGGGGPPQSLDCGDGKIMGFNLRTGALVDKVGAICGKYIVQ